MTIDNMIQGLQIFRKYFDSNKYCTSAEYDVFCVYPTDTPLSEEDYITVCQLGWFQPEVDSVEDPTYSEYDPEEGWQAFT